MTPKHLLGLAVLLCYLSEIATRPSNNESASLPGDISDKSPRAIEDKEDGSVYYQTDTDTNIQDDSTKEIVEKIKAINSILNKPTHEQINYNTPYHEIGNSIDEETLQKLKQIIASGKHHPYSIPKNQPRNSYQTNDDRDEYSRALNLFSSMYYPNPLPIMPYSYPMNYPVLTIPNANEILSRYAAYNNFKILNDAFRTSQQQPSPSFSSTPSFSFENIFQPRQEQQPFFPGLPSFPSFSFHNLFPSQPFGHFFPVLIKNPFVAFNQGGGLENLVEYGQNADVCNRKQKSHIDEDSQTEDKYSVESSVPSEPDNNTPIIISSPRKSRALRKRTVLSEAPEQEVESTIRKVHGTKSNVIRKTSKKPSVIENVEDLKQSDDDSSLRFPFFHNGFTLFGDKKPVLPSPGFFINKLRVRKGGVAIAGPGGIATAGKGGTAIVGPGGLAYTKPGGLAIAGPHARVVALPQYSDFPSYLSRALRLDGESRALQPITEGKLVATGPVIYYHPTEPAIKKTAAIQYIPFYGGAKGQYLEVKKDTKGAVLSEKIVAEESISSENMMKNHDDNLLSKVLAANLQNLRSLSSNLLKIHNLGRKTGSLGSQEKARFKTQLFSLGEAASNTIKLIDEIDDDIDVLFKKNATLLRQYGENDEEDVGEEGVAIESASDSSEVLERAIIAEAKPVGLAVIGESGLAASRPMATAVASSGVAIARPIGTAIAGIDPTLLGIDFQVNQKQKSIKFNGKSY